MWKARVTRPSESACPQGHACTTVATPILPGYHPRRRSGCGSAWVRTRRADPGALQFLSSALVFSDVSPAHVDAYLHCRGGRPFILQAAILQRWNLITSLTLSKRWTIQTSEDFSMVAAQRTLMLVLASALIVSCLVKRINIPFPSTPSKPATN